ncbi:MAG: hypothetical protein QM831_11440 [Kofleriaceae bacterium]
MVASFASYFPEAALEDFNRGQRNEPDLAMRMLHEKAASCGRWFDMLSVQRREDDTRPRIEIR